jgi:uncharacterized protein with PQ loop repeat
LDDIPESLVPVGVRGIIDLGRISGPVCRDGEIMLSTIQLIGWISSILFALAGAPQAYQSYKRGNSEGMSKLFLIMWTLGEILMMAYIILMYGYDIPLLVNGIFNLIFLAIIWRYTLSPTCVHAREGDDERTDNDIRELT